MKDYDYYTVDEILQALESNTDDVLTKAVIWSKRIVRKSGLAIEAEEVFNEALLRILEDDRHLPKDIPRLRYIRSSFENSRQAAKKH